MDPSRSRSTTISIQHKPQPSVADSKPDAIWNDMSSWMERRRREWDDEMEQLKNEFFSRKADPGMLQGTSRIRRNSNGSCSSCSDVGSSLQDKASISSRVFETDSGARMFCATFDVSQFEPSEIQVRTQQHCLIVHARHEEQRENKSVSREFNRQINIPTEIDPQTLRCIIKDDGTLQVEAELPSPSCYGSARDSPVSTDTASFHSLFGDRSTERATLSPPRSNRDIFGSTAMGRDIHSLITGPRNTFSPIAEDRDIGSPTKEPRCTFSPTFGQGTYDPPTDDRDSLYPASIRRNIYGLASKDRDEDVSSRMDRLQIGSFPRMDRGGCTPNRLNPVKSNGPAMISHDPGRQQLNGWSLGYGCPGTGADPGSTDQWNSGDTRRSDYWTSGDTCRSGQLYSGDSNGSWTTGEISQRYQRTSDDAYGHWPGGVPTINGHDLDDLDAFRVIIEVGPDFDPEDLDVKAVDRKLIVHARNTGNFFGQTEDMCSRDICREFDLPVGVDPWSLQANLTTDGTLIIEVTPSAKTFCET